MGRPRLPASDRPVPLCLRATPETADFVIHLATAQDVSVYAFLGHVFERLRAQWKTHPPPVSGYSPAQPSSTLSLLLSEPTSTRSLR